MNLGDLRDIRYHPLLLPSLSINCIWNVVVRTRTDLTGRNLVLCSHSENAVYVDTRLLRMAWTAGRDMRRRPPICVRIQPEALSMLL